MLPEAVNQEGICPWHGVVQARSVHSCIVGVCAHGTVLCRAGKECSFEDSAVLSLRMIGQGLLGAILFLNGAQLSQSLAFRLGTGSIGFALLSALVVVFVLARYFAPVQPSSRWSGSGRPLNLFSLSSQLHEQGEQLIVQRSGAC